MTEKDKKFIETWEIALAMGRNKFAIKYGFFFAIFTFVISNAILYFVFSDTDVLQVSRMITSLVSFLIVGFSLSYFFTWKQNNKKYNSLLNQ